MYAWSITERVLCRFLLIIAGITLAFMFLFTLLDVIMRAFGRPIVGDYEVISFLGAVVFGFSIPYTSALKGHVIVDFLIEKLPGKAESAVQVATRLICMALFLWMSWNFIQMSLDLIKNKEVTPVFRLPYYPISFGLAFACLVQCLPLLSQIAEAVGGKHE